MDIAEKYQKYNYSSTKCYILTLKFRSAGVYGIEHKLPHEIGRLKGIYISCNTTSPLPIVGGIILNFNEGGLKNFQMPLDNTRLFPEQTEPFPFDEEIKTNSIMQGFYAISPAGEPSPQGYIKIYLHYEARDVNKT